jgi:hypothetical protein
VTVTVSNGGGTTPPPGSQNVVWTSTVNAAVSGNTISKSGGCDGCFDAGAISQQTIASGDGAVEFTVPAGVYLSAGLSNGNSGPAAEEIKFALRFYPGSPGYVEVRESGAYKADWPLVAGAVHKVAVEGGVVKYYQSGVLKYTSAVAPAYPLLVDAALGTLNSAVQNAVITTGSGGGGGTTDTTPPAASVSAPAGGATVSGTAVTVSATASDNVGVAGVQFKLDGANLGAEDTTAPYAISWNTTTATNGAHALTAVARDAAGNATTSAPVTVTVSNGTTPPPGSGPQNVVWTSAVNVAVNGNTITKNAGCSGCGDAGAISQQAVGIGDGYVEFTVAAGTNGTVGLSTGNAGTTGNEIKWGLRFYPGTPGYVEVRESGAYKWDFAAVTGAVYRIAVEAGVVSYYQNGVLKYASTVPPTYPMLLDSSLNTVGSAVQGAVITQ